MKITRTQYVLIAIAVSCTFVAIVVGVLVVAAGRDYIHHPETGYTFPNTGDISHMRAIEIGDRATSGHRSFDVPSLFWDDVLAALCPSEYDSDPRKMLFLGTLELECVHRDTIIVQLYSKLGSIGEFSVGRDSSHASYYRGGNSDQLERALVEAYVHRQ
jgi:hypothetical protein